VPVVIVAFWLSVTLSLFSSCFHLALFAIGVHLYVLFVQFVLFVAGIVLSLVKLRSCTRKHVSLAASP
jgi:hypothetical protein